MNEYQKAADIIKNSNFLVAFTGAGISKESGVPTFRGEDGLWSKYDPIILDIDYFKQNPKESWEAIRDIFYKYMQNVKPNDAHYFLADLEKRGILKGIVTQNIDNLHQKAGNKNVIEFHGNTRDVVCMNCNRKFSVDIVDFDNLPPFCPVCGGILKPDFVFFGEPIPEDAFNKSIELMQNADALLIIGTTGEIMPASQLPYLCKGKIIEINPNKSAYTDKIVDVYIPQKAGVAAKKLKELL
jgi:NAD-dependent deacetylase